MAWYDVITNTPVYYNGDWSVPYWLKKPMYKWDNNIPGGDASHRILSQQYVIRHDDYVPLAFNTPHPNDPVAYLVEEQMSGIEIAQVAIIDATFARIPTRVFQPSRYAWSDPQQGVSYFGAKGYFQPTLQDDDTPDQVNLDFVTEDYTKTDSFGASYTTTYNEDDKNSVFYGNMDGFTMGMDMSIAIQDTPNSTPNTIFTFKDVMRQPTTKGRVVAISGNRITLSLSRPFTLNAGWVYKVLGNVGTLANAFKSRTYPCLMMNDFFLPTVSDGIDTVLDIPTAEGFNASQYVSADGVFDGVGYYNFLSQDGWILIEPTGLELWRGNIWKRTARYIRTKYLPELDTVPMFFNTLPSP